MILTGQMIAEIKRLAEQITAIKEIHINLLPTGVERPCLLIKESGYDAAEVSAGLRLVTQKLRLTLTGAVDAEGNCNAAALLSLREEVMGLFEEGYIRVLDRALKLFLAGAGAEGDTSFVDITLTFYDDRGSTPQPPSPIETVTTTLTRRGTS